MDTSPWAGSDRDYSYEEVSRTNMVKSRSIDGASWLLSY